MNYRRLAPWLALGGIVLILGLFYATYPPHNSGGDIVEYFGMTESLKNHGSVVMTAQDKENLKQYLNSGYFVNTQGTDNNGGFLYILPGRDGNNYPVHFFLYSLVVLPVRLGLEAIGQPATNALRFTNLMCLALTIMFIFLRYVKTPRQQLLLLLFTFVSPILSFIIWPGPDIFYLSLLLVGVFAWFHHERPQAILLCVLASWQSQPLAILAGLLTLWYMADVLKIDTRPSIHTLVHRTVRQIPFLLLAAFLVVLPYLYNYVVFGVLTPWTILQDGWTQRYGFGFQNVNMRKLYEQFFDPNMGIFIYAPFLVTLGFWIIFHSIRKTGTVFILFLVFFITAFFYQTNPAWNYGTAGYGPSRHIIYLLPFLVAITLLYWPKPQKLVIPFIVVLFLIQGAALAMNHDTAPLFENSLDQSPIATYILNHSPGLYNPTPDIFVDRTNHTDLKFMKTAVYQYNGICKKAYVADADVTPLITMCGYIPQQYIAKLYSNNPNFYVTY